MLAEIASIVSTIIAASALIVSIRAYKRGVPKLKLEIEDPKYDCFFGDVRYKNIEARISGIRFILRNESSACIEIFGMELKVNNEFFRLIPADIEMWEEVSFLVDDSNEGRIEDYVSIPYLDEGIRIPLVIDGFHSYVGYALFHDFPARITGKVKAKVYIKTAVGTITKKIVLREYDNTFSEKEMMEVEQFIRSRG